MYEKSKKINCYFFEICNILTFKLLLLCLSMPGFYSFYPGRKTKYKLIAYLSSRGFERDLIAEIIKE